MDRREVALMSRRRRYLALLDVHASLDEAFLADQEKQFASYPEAAHFTDEEAEDFLAAAVCWDCFDHEALMTMLKRARITWPPELTFDEYRLGRHIFRRWGDPDFRESFLQRFVHFEYGPLARLRRTGAVEHLGPSIADIGSPTLVSIMRRHGMSDLIPALMETLTAAGMVAHTGLLLFSKVLMHRCITEPEPPRQPSRWEQQKLARRIRLREVQLSSMQGSLHRLNRDRMALMARLRKAGRQDGPELDALATELAHLRLARAEAERRHMAAMAEEARTYREAIARLRDELAFGEPDYNDMLAIRRAWLPVSRRR